MEEGKIVYGDWPEPESAPGKVIVQVKACGICGSDVPRVLGTEAHFYPIVIGHEFSGIVVDVGEGVTNVKRGDYVAGCPLVPCMKCDDCMRGNYSLCKHYSFIGSREQGAFAEYVSIPAQNAIPFDPVVPFDLAAFFEPSTIGLHGVLNSGMRGGGTVAILGGGTIGLFTAIWAKLLGADKVAVFDIENARLELAKKYGADRGFNTGTNSYKEEARDWTKGRGFDYVFETAGVAPTEILAFEEAANKGRVTFIGTPHSPLTWTQAQWENLNRKELEVTGTWMSYSAPFPGREWHMTAEYLGDGRLTEDRSLIFREFPLKEITVAFDLFRNPRDVKGKVLVVEK
jgi:L-iditol 2-dehydrogenase